MKKIMKGIIYKAENVFNGYVYVGATTKSIEKRKKDHFKRANIGQVNKFQEAISTYGTEAFLWEQIDTACSSDELAHKEKQYILKYNSKEEGYNQDSGGGFKKRIYQYDISVGTCIQSFNCLQSAADAVNADKKQISRACLSVNQTFGGYRWSYTYKKKFVPNSDKRLKEVKQFETNGKWIKTYSSLRAASYSTGVNRSSIAKVCRGERKTAGGFMWRYL